MIFSMIFLTIHTISYYKVEVSTGIVETRWLGGSFLKVYRNNTGRLGSGFISVCAQATEWRTAVPTTATRKGPALGVV